MRGPPPEQPSTTCQPHGGPSPCSHGHAPPTRCARTHPRPTLPSPHRSTEASRLAHGKARHDDAAARRTSSRHRALDRTRPTPVDTAGVRRQGDSAKSTAAVRSNRASTTTQISPCPPPPRTATLTGPTPHRAVSGPCPPPRMDVLADLDNDHTSTEARYAAANPMRPSVAALHEYDVPAAAINASPTPPCTTPAPATGSPATSTSSSPHPRRPPPRTCSPAANGAMSGASHAVALDIKLPDAYRAPKETRKRMAAASTP